MCIITAPVRAMGREMACISPAGRWYADAGTSESRRARLRRSHGTASALTGELMSERQKQHQGRSTGDDTTLEGRDIEADARPGVGSERVNGAIEGGAEASEQAQHIGRLLEDERRASGASANEDDAASGGR